MSKFEKIHVGLSSVEVRELRKAGLMDDLDLTPLLEDQRIRPRRARVARETWIAGAVIVLLVAFNVLIWQGNQSADVPKQAGTPPVETPRSPELSREPLRTELPPDGGTIQQPPLGEWFILNNLANIYADTGRTELSIQTFRKAIEANPGYSQAHFNLGRLYHELGQLELSQSHYEMALRFKDSNPIYVDASGIDGWERIKALEIELQKRADKENNQTQPGGVLNTRGGGEF